MDEPAQSEGPNAQSDVCDCHVCYSAAEREAEYCDERVSICVCVCLSVRDHILGTARLIFTKILCMIPVAVVRSSSGGVLICYVGLLPVFTADVIFAHKPRLLHVAGQLKRSAHAALGSAIKRVQ